MKYLYLILLTVCCLPFSIKAGESYCFRVYLKDKGENPYPIGQPEAFLSKEAIERRTKQGIPVTDSDLPISPTYLDTLAAAGARPIVQSKWFRTVVVASEDSLIVERLCRLSIVDSVKWVWKGETEALFPPKKEETSEVPERYETKDSPTKSRYGYAEEQIRILNGIPLHEAGFKGEGMRVAVIDAGFKHVDRISAFDSLKLLGTHNVVHPGTSVFEGDDHGTKVLSCLAAQIPGVIVGTAPAASYWLIKSEDSRSEYPIEEDYWTAAIEFADSVGVEVISSSLGYFTFDAETLSHRQEELDGETALISRAAHMASEKGLLLFCSAGNEGSGSWKKITVPADAQGIVTVGAITPKKKRSTFSSLGPTADGRIKPDLVAMGSGCCVIGYDGEIRYSNGTSFSTPTLAGLAICLWQALPWLSHTELITLMQRSGSQFKHPDAELGYGIPNLYKIYKRQRKHAVKHH